MTWWSKMSENNNSFDTMLLSLIENIRNEITSLNAELHGLEINLKSIELLDQKNEHLQEKIGNVVSKMVLLEQKLDELIINSASHETHENVQKEFIKLTSEIDLLKTRCSLIESDITVLKDLEISRKQKAEKIQQFIIAIFLAIFGTFLSWYFK